MCVVLLSINSGERGKKVGGEKGGGGGGGGAQEKMTTGESGLGCKI